MEELDAKIVDGVAGPAVEIREVDEATQTLHVHLVYLTSIAEHQEVLGIDDPAETLTVMLEMVDNAQPGENTIPEFHEAVAATVEAYHLEGETVRLQSSVGEAQQAVAAIQAAVDADPALLQAARITDTGQVITGADILAARKNDLARLRERRRTLPEAKAAHARADAARAAARERLGHTTRARQGRASKSKTATTPRGKALALLGDESTRQTIASLRAQVVQALKHQGDEP